MVSDATRRNVEAQEVRQSVAALGSAAHVIVAGDFNLTSSTDASYRTLTAAGAGQVIDPANPGNNWTASSIFRGLLTESATNLRIRDDVQFITAPLQSGLGLQAIPGSYAVFGNNGSITFDNAITAAAGNTSLSDLSNQAVVLGAADDYDRSLAERRRLCFVTVPEPSTWILALLGGTWLWRQLRRGL